MGKHIYDDHEMCKIMDKIAKSRKRDGVLTNE